MYLKVNSKSIKALVASIGLVGFLSACVSNNNSGGSSQYLTVSSTKSAVHGLQQLSIVTNNPTLRDVAYGNEVYVVVGDSGAILTSKDGISWEAQSGVVQGNLSGITYNPVKKLFYAIGDNGLIISSANGVSWTIYTSLNPPVKLSSIMSVNGNEVIAGESGSVFEIAVKGNRDMVTVRSIDSNAKVTSTSFNGRDTMVIGSSNGDLYYKSYSNFSSSNWTRVETFTDMPISDISYDALDSWFVATTLNGTVIQSMDGKTWSTPVSVDPLGSASMNLNSIVVEPITNRFLVVGGDMAQNSFVLFSSDFNQWNYDSLAGKYPIQKVRCFESDTCVAVGDKKTLLFANKKDDLSGMSWREIDLSPPRPDVSYVAVGQRGTVLVSGDGKSWLTESSMVNGSLNSVSYSTKLGRYIITGFSGSILTSSDGYNWLKESSNTSSSLYGYSSSADTLLIPGTSATILTSSDGLNWESRETNLSKTVNLYGSAYGNNKFIVIGTDGMIISSTDGISWKKENADTAEYLSSIIYDGKQFVIVGTHGVILTSANGIDWNKQRSNVEVDLNDLIYENNLYVIVGNDGTILKSDDAITWNAFHASEDPKFNLHSITYFKNQYVAVGGSGTILTSKDSIKWEKELSGTSAGLYNIKSY